MKVRRSEQKRRRRDLAGSVDSSSGHSGTGQDSGFGSDSARIRIVQIEQQSGASHHCIARPSHKSSITKNLSFIPFDIFLTASRLSVMTYSCSSSSKAFHSSSDVPGTPEEETGQKVKPYEKSKLIFMWRTRLRIVSSFQDWLVVCKRHSFLELRYDMIQLRAANQHHLGLLKLYKMYTFWQPVHHCSCALYGVWVVICDHRFCLTLWFLLHSSLLQLTRLCSLPRRLLWIWFFCDGENVLTERFICHLLN